MTAAGFTISGEDHPIAPVMIGDAKLASDMADDMLSKSKYLCTNTKEILVFQIKLVKSNRYRTKTIQYHFQREEFS